MNGKRGSGWAAALLLLAALALYLVSLDNGLRPGELAGGDLITHQYAQVQGRPSNAPGYPLYTVGGWLWFHGWRALLGPDSNPTAILSAYSTLWALVALWLLYRLVIKLTDNWLVALLSGAFYACTYFFWFYAASTEQYTSAVALTLAIALLALVWDERQTTAAQAGSESPAGDGILLALAFLCGLSLAHLVTVAFIVPPLLWFVLRRRPGLLRRVRFLAKAAVLALLPLLSYAFVYVRGAQHPEWRGAGQWPSTWAWFWDFISTQQGRSELTWSLRPFWTAEFPSLIWGELTWIVLLGGLIGLVLMGRRRGTFFGATLLIYLAFSFVDRLGNWYQVIMPAYALLVASFAVTVQWLWQWLGDRATRLTADPRRQRTVRHAIYLLLAVGLALLVLARFQMSWPRTNQRDRPADTALQPGQAILADDPAHGAAVLGLLDENLSLRYLTEIWGRRPDVTGVSSDQARALLDSASRPLYVTTAAAPLVGQEVSPQAHLSSAGADLIAVSQGPATQLPAAAQVIDLLAGDGLALAGYQILPADATPEAAQLHVRLFWQALRPIEHDWSVSVRPTLGGQLVRQPDGTIVQADLAAPVHGTYPTGRWQPGEVVADDYLLPVPARQPADGLQVVVYRPLPEGGFDNLAVLELPLN